MMDRAVAMPHIEAVGRGDGGADPGLGGADRGKPLFFYGPPAALGVHYHRRERAMDTLTISAASGLRARMESLDMLANNLANNETSGYKTDREFYNLYVSADAAEAADPAATTLPVIERPQKFPHHTAKISW